MAGSGLAGGQSKMGTISTQEYIAKKYSLNQMGAGPVSINIGRLELASLFSELGFTEGVEIGTEQGLYAETLCKANPNLHLYCVDPWRVYDNNLGYHPAITQQQVDSFYKEAVEKLRPYNTTIIKKMSAEAVVQFADNSLDFVYIDGNHRLEYVVNDLVEWTKKVRPGGIVSGHDYIQYKYQHYSHVVEALKAYHESYRRGLPWFVLESRRGHKYRSWFFIK